MKRFPTLLCFVSCLIVTSCGSDGNGDSWETVELGTDAEFRDVFFLDTMNGWIVGSAGLKVPGGIIGRTRDGGQTWKFETGLIHGRSRAMSIDLNAIHFIDPLHGCIAAESGSILHTADGGESWERVPPSGPIYAHNRDLCFVDDRNGWIIGRQGVLRTKDGGASWLRVDKEKKMDGNAIHFLDLERGWVVGKFGSVHRTEDGGVTWKKIEALGDLEGLDGDDIPTLTSVHFADENHGWIAGYLRESTFEEQHDHAVIIHTNDGGRTWKHQLDGVEALLKSIRFADVKCGWAVGYNVNDSSSSVLHTEDGGRNWQIQTTISGEKLLALDVRDDHAWAVGDRVLKSSQRLLRLVPSAGVGGRDINQGVGESDPGE